MRKCKIFAAVVLAVSLMSSAVSSYAASGFYFNGGYKIVNNNGAAVTIETQNPTITSYVSAWAMTCDSSVSDRYAQVGWWKETPTTSPKYFYEYSYGDLWYQKSLGTATVGSHNDYMVGCDSTTMYFKINGTSYGTVALSKIPFSRNTIELMGETHNTNDQCMGSNSNPVTMGSAQYKSTGNVWTTTKCVNSGSSLGYGSLSTMRNNIASGGSTNWEIWDSRY